MDGREAVRECQWEGLGIHMEGAVEVRRRTRKSRRRRAPCSSRGGAVPRSNARTCENSTTARARALSCAFAAVGDADGRAPAEGAHPIMSN